MAYPWRDRLTADNLRRRTVKFIIDNVGNEKQYAHIILRILKTRRIIVHHRQIFLLYYIIIRAI